LLARELPEEGLRDYTNVIIEEADRLRNLVDRMLGSNKLPSLAMTNIHEVLERSAAWSRPKARAASLWCAITTQAAGRVDRPRTDDPGRANIVRNAMQAISSQNELRLGRITLRSRAMRQFTIGHVRHRLVAR
jgi:two-component system nitrogen regulation sensor histidine kinase GlnL